MEVKSQLKSAQLEHFPDAGFPAFGVKNRIIVSETTGRVFIDTGTEWKAVGSSAVGDVKQSFLTEVQFIAENGGTWILADGRSIVGTDYGILTGQSNAPDCRAMFLRSGNLGRADGFVDPNGDQAAGVEQSDTTALNGISASSNTTGSHSHSYNEVKFGGGNYSGVSGTHSSQSASTGGAGSHDHIITLSGSNPETAPNHIIVNTFIKVYR